MKQLPGLLANGREQFVRRRPGRHQRGDPPQSCLDPRGRRLLLGELGKLADQDRDNSPDNREADQREQVGLQVSTRAYEGRNEEELPRQDAEHDRGESRSRATKGRGR